MINYLREYGSGLISNGYHIVPIRRGGKAPNGIAGWTTIEADLNQLGQWISAGFEGVGVLTKNNPAIDIDIMDEDISREMVERVNGAYPGGLIRVGKYPKTLLAYRTDAPFRKVRSNTYEDQFGDQHAVEILGDGQQYVAYAEHPDTLRPYTWHNEDNTASQGIFVVESASLPIIRLEDARLVVSWFEEIAQRKVLDGGWVKVRGGQGGGEGDGGDGGDTTEEHEREAFSNLRPRLNLTEAEILRALSSINADDYDKWIRVGMAIWHECGGSEEGFTYWHNWSIPSPRYTDERSCRIRWRGFRTRRRGRTITFATILHWAREVRMRENPLGEFKERYVYVADGDNVHDLGGLGHDKPLQLKEFKNMTANIITTVTVPAPTQANPERTTQKRVPVHQLWLTDLDRKTARGFAYVPTYKPILIDAEKKEYINTFHTPKFVNPCKTVIENGVEKLDEACCNELLAIFFRHMEYILPIEVEREWFYSWMSFNIQKPGMRCKVTPLLIATDHGTGRGWIVELMTSLLGGWNCEKTKMSTLNGESGAGQFQDYMNNSLLCCIEEVKDGDKRYGVTDTIRDYLTENTLEINLKYGAKATKPIYTNFFWMSNHADAVVLTEEDRRINVFKTEDKPKGNDYYERLYQWLEDKGDNSETGSTEGNTSDIVVDSDSPNFTLGGDGDNGDNNSGVPESNEDTSSEVYDRGGLKVSAGVACLWHWLNQRNISKFNWKRSMTNRSRRDMIENNMSEVERMFWNVVENPPYSIMTAKEIQDFMLSMAGEEIEMFVFQDNQKAQIRKLMQQHLQKQEQVKITKKVAKIDENSVTTLEGSVTTNEEKWMRFWGFRRGHSYTKAEMREMYEKR